MRRLAALTAAPTLALVLSLACGGEDAEKAASTREAGEGAAASAALARIREGPHDIAVIAVAGIGEIRVELLPEIAPQTVANFEKLARRGFFDGTTFHRVIPGFMIQGGDPNSRSPDPRRHGKGGPGYTIPDEFTDLPHRRGTVSMANKGAPHTAGSQFFIVHRDAPHLDGHYTAFGRVVAGMETVDAITEVAIDKYGRYGPKDRPYPESVVVESIRIEPAEGGRPRAADAPGAAGVAKAARAAAAGPP